MTLPQPQTQTQKLTLADIIRTRVDHDAPLPITLSPVLTLEIVQKTPSVFWLIKENVLPSAEECAAATAAIHEVIGHTNTRQFDRTFRGLGLSIISEPPTPRTE